MHLKDMNVKSIEKIIQAPFKPIIEWVKVKFPYLNESNRAEHLVYAIPCGFLFTMIFVVGLALGMEYKDHLKGGKFDVIDFWVTILGGAIGQLLNLIVLICTYNLIY